MRKFLVLCAVSLVIGIMVPSLILAGAKFYEGDYDIAITNAYYTCLEYDGLEDDIVIYLFIERDDGYEGVKNWIKIYLELELPSGTILPYEFDVRTDQLNFALCVIAWDAAIEPGWYTIRAYEYDDDGFDDDDYVELVFDPPGSGGGAEPPSIWSWAFAQN